jgi:hypothetical protein
MKKVHAHIFLLSFSLLTQVEKRLDGRLKADPEKLGWL